MSEKKQLMINVVSNFIYMVINYAITFFLTSYVVTSISEEAYGFISLCNNVVNYATLITIALNSVSGRFITIEMHKGNQSRAKKYFSSTLIADMVICIVILVFFVPLSLKIQYFFNIPQNLIQDVSVLFLLVTFNLLITVFTSVYTVSTFITNKLYLSSIANASGNIIRAILLTILMKYCSPSIVYVGIATVASSCIILIFNVIYTRRLCPELKIHFADISFGCLKELLASGIWNSITKLAQILSDGIDLVISNIWIGTYEMGQLSIAYTIPTIVSSFLSMIINVFNPKLTEYYAKGNIEKVINELKINMKMTAFFGNIIFFGIVIMGKDLFLLWVPTANVDMVYKLVILATISLLVSAIVSPLSNVFLLTNKLKVNSLLWLGVSTFDAIVVLILVNTTNLGVYAVAGVSKIVGAIVNIIFLPSYAAYCLKVKSKVLYKVVGQYAFSSIIAGTFMILCRQLLGTNNTWFLFAVRVIILAGVGMLSNYLVFFDRTEKQYFINTIGKKLHFVK